MGHVRQSFSLYPFIILTLRPAGPQEVIVTGTFDSWKQTLPLVKQSDGSFEITVPLEPKETLFKYVVDGEWLTNQNQKIKKSDGYIENNYLSPEDFHTASNGSRIPEAGGLVASAAPGLTTTVMPTSEGQQQTLGEPGIFIPKDQDTLAAFEKVEDVDSRNLSAAEKKVQKKKLKKIQYKARRKQKAAAEKLGVAGVGSESSASSEPELAASQPLKQIPSDTLDPAVKAAGVAGVGAQSPNHESVVPVPEAKSATPEIKEAVKPAEFTSSLDESAETPFTGNPEPKVSEKEEDSRPTASEGHPAVAIIATTEIVENIINVELPSHEHLDSAPISGGKDAAYIPTTTETGAEEKEEEDDFKSFSDEGSVNPSIVAVHQANVVPTVVGTPDIQDQGIQRKTLAPEPVSKSSAVAAGVQAPPAVDENQNTLDPTVVGAIGGSTVNEHSANSVAKEISNDEQPERVIEPAITRPIEPEPKVADEGKKVGKETPESVLAAPIKPLGAKEVEASPVHEKPETEEIIIITQGGDDVNAIEEKILAAEDGPVLVEQIQPTESEARELAEEAHIPESSLGLDKKPKKASKNKKVKEKKKSGFVAKIKKVFK